MPTPTTTLNPQPCVPLPPQGKTCIGFGIDEIPDPRFLTSVFRRQMAAFAEQKHELAEILIVFITCFEQEQP